MSLVPGAYLQGVSEGHEHRRGLRALRAVGALLQRERPRERRARGGRLPGLARESVPRRARSVALRAQINLAPTESTDHGFLHTV